MRETMTEQDEDRSSQDLPFQGQEHSCVGWSSWDSSSADFPVPPIQSSHKKQTKLTPAFYHIQYLLWTSGVFGKTGHQLLKPLQIPQITHARALEILGSA